MIFFVTTVTVCISVKFGHFLLFSAKATYSAIAKLYGYLTPDLWEETVFMKSPFQEFTDYLAKNHVRAKVALQSDQH